MYDHMYAGIHARTCTYTQYAVCRADTMVLRALLGQVAPVDTLYAPRGRTVPDPVQAQAPALIAGTTYYVQHPEELKEAIAAFERQHGGRTPADDLPVSG